MAEEAGRTLIFTVTKSYDNYYYRASAKKNSATIKKTETTKVDVYVLQKPIVTKPTNVSFTIEITVSKSTSENAKQIIEKEISFSITPTVDDRDLDRSFNGYINEHLWNIEGYETILDDRWQAPTAKINYIAAFYQLIKRLRTKPGEREQSENPHVERRKKMK